MRTNWITLVSSLAFTMEMQIRFATKKKERRINTITIFGKSSAMKTDWFFLQIIWFLYIPIHTLMPKISSEYFHLCEILLQISNDVCFSIKEGRQKQNLKIHRDG